MFMHYKWNKGDIINKEYPDKLVQEAISIAEKLSHHYSKKFPDVDFSEFYSVSMIAITQALRTFNKKKGSFDFWCSFYIYGRFHNLLLKEKRKQDMIKRLQEKYYNGISIYMGRRKKWQKRKKH